MGKNLSRSPEKSRNISVKEEFVPVNDTSRTESKKAEHDRRAAEALRANLRRRKAQKTEKSDEKAEADTEK